MWIATLALWLARNDGGLCHFEPFAKRRKIHKFFIHNVKIFIYIIKVVMICGKIFLWLGVFELGFGEFGGKFFECGFLKNKDFIILSGVWGI